MLCYVYDHNLIRRFHLIWYMYLNEIDNSKLMKRYNYGIKRLLYIFGNIPFHDICMNADLTIFVSLMLQTRTILASMFGKYSVYKAFSGNRIMEAIFTISLSAASNFMISEKINYWNLKKASWNVLYTCNLFVSLLIISLRVIKISSLDFFTGQAIPGEVLNIRGRVCETPESEEGPGL